MSNQNAHFLRKNIVFIIVLFAYWHAQGMPLGSPTIRFDTGNGNNPHINIDAAGKSAKTNPHIQVPAELVDTAKVINKTIKYAGITLTVVAVAIDAWRICSAFADDVYVRDNAWEIIRELEGSIAKLKKAYESETDSQKRRKIRATIEHLEKVLRDVNRCRKVPVTAIKKVSSVGGGWTLGMAGGWAGAWGGSQAGAAVGSLFGPVGAVVGAPIGAVVGAISGGVAAGMAGSTAGEAIAEKALTLADD